MPKAGKDDGSLNKQSLNDSEKAMNITVGNYETKNFDISPSAASAFGDFSTDEKNIAVKVENAAKFVDNALGIIKSAMMVGSLNHTAFDTFLEDIDHAEELLDDADELEHHHYLRDELEPMAVEMYDLSDIDPNDEADSYEDEEEWLFGDEDSH